MLTIGQLIIGLMNNGIIPVSDANDLLQQMGQDAEQLIGPDLVDHDEELMAIGSNAGLNFIGYDPREIVRRAVQAINNASPLMIQAVKHRQSLAKQPAYEY